MSHASTREKIGDLYASDLCEVCLRGCYYGGSLSTGVNASSSCCKKKFTGNFSLFSQYLGQNAFFFFFFLRRDRKAYANNPSYRLPLFNEELTEL